MSEKHSHNRPQNDDIELRSVRFLYPGKEDGKAIFSNLDLRIDAGSHIAITGKNGAGKSTLVNLILGFDRVNSGSITLGGIPISELGWDGLFEKISFAPQGDAIIGTTLRENLLLFNHSCRDELLDEILDLTGLKHFIDDGDLHLDREVGENGVLLSGGQRQRLVLARALIRDCPIYIFDESTSALPEAEAVAMVTCVLKYLKYKTVLFVTHSNSIADVFEKQILVADESCRWVRGGLGISD